MFLFTGFN